MSPERTVQAPHRSPRAASLPIQLSWVDSERQAVAAAAAAGTGAVLTTVTFFPVELIKNRLQSATRNGKREGFAYSGLVDGLSTVLREEGVRGLFTGLLSVLARALASDFATVFFGELLVSRYGARDGAIELPLRVVGGWVSVALTLPLELVSTRVTCTRPPLTAFAAVRELWVEGGLGAFWRGFRLMLVLCLNPALTFTAFGWLRRLAVALRSRLQRSLWLNCPWDLSRHGEHSALAPTSLALQWWEAFLVGIAAKLATLLVVYPLIRAKFLLQAGGTRTNHRLFELLRRVALERRSSWAV